MIAIKDTYFFNPKKALLTARKKNILTLGDKKLEHSIFTKDIESQKRQTFYKDLQICYYHGEPLKDKDIPKNCINVPVNNIFDFFKKTELRFPEMVNFDGLDIQDSEKDTLIQLFRQTFVNVNNYQENETAIYMDKLKQCKPDFKEPLRIFFMASRFTTVMQYVSKNIAKTFEDMGYEVYISIEKNHMEYLNIYHHTQSMLKFKPHVTININHLNNEFIHEDVFNFVWVQDPNDYLLDNRKIHTRENDIIFHLIEDFRIFLKNKGIKSAYQGFCINNNIFKIRESIKRTKKIVFIGSSYEDRILDLKKDKSFNEIYNTMISIFEKKSYLSDKNSENSDILWLMTKYNKSEKYIQSIKAYLERNYVVEKLCQLKDIIYQIEIYGYGWENNKIVSKYYKGSIAQGKDVSKIYNSATYALCPGGYVIMQRTLESAASGAIPLVLDVRKNKQSNYSKKIEKSLEFFKLKDLENILKRKTFFKKNLNLIVKEYSYNKFVKKIIKILDKNKILSKR